MPETGPSLKDRILKETAVLGSLILAGLLVLPMLVYFVGKSVFGEYGGAGFADFYVRLHQDLRHGEPAAVFLLLSPCILWLLLRLSLWLFRRPEDRRS
jgi:hypothetical protein